MLGIVKRIYVNKMFSSLDITDYIGKDNEGIHD
jgi:hypothetical protein